jgi:hypothetical protein
MTSPPMRATMLSIDSFGSCFSSGGRGARRTGSGSIDSDARNASTSAGMAFTVRRRRRAGGASPERWAAWAALHQALAQLAHFPRRGTASLRGQDRPQPSQATTAPIARSSLLGAS